MTFNKVVVQYWWLLEWKFNRLNCMKSFILFTYLLFMCVKSPQERKTCWWSELLPVVKSSASLSWGSTITRVTDAHLSEEKQEFTSTNTGERWAGYRLSRECHGPHTLFAVLLQLNSGALMRWDGQVAGCVLSLLYKDH